MLSLFLAGVGLSRSQEAASSSSSSSMVVSPASWVKNSSSSGGGSDHDGGDGGGGRRAVDGENGGLMGWRSGLRRRRRRRPCREKPEKKTCKYTVDFTVTTRSRKQRRLVYIGEDLRENDERRPQRSRRRRKRNRRLGFKKLILTISWEYQTGTEFLQQPGTEHYTLAEYKVYDAGRQTLNSLQINSGELGPGKKNPATCSHRAKSA
nr:hypothetical protein Itr_chr09CG01990 [Ipomoea trifida]